MSTTTKPLVVGIAGGSASGKTTLSQRLVEHLPDVQVQVIHMDHYFKVNRPHMVAPFTGIEYEDHNHPDSFEMDRLVADLDALLAAEQAPEVIIVEGLLTLQNDAIRQRLDLGLFVDAQSDERIVRRLRRNMARGMDFDEISTFFLDSVRHRHQEYVEPSRWYADLVLNGSSGSPRGVCVVAEWIRQHLPSRSQM